jgi:hypothetical protein
LTLQTDGNLIEYNSSGVPLWTSRTAGKTVTAMILQSDGNLVLFDGTTPVWSSGTGGHIWPILTVEDNGAVVIISGGKQIWTSVPQIVTN